MSFVVCDDSKITAVDAYSAGDTNIVYTHSSVNTGAVVLVYDRHFANNKQFLPVLLAIQNTSGLTAIIDAMESTPSRERKQRVEIAIQMKSGAHSQNLLSEIDRVVQVEFVDLMSCKEYMKTLIQYLACSCELLCNSFCVRPLSLCCSRSAATDECIVLICVNAELNLETIEHSLLASTGCSTLPVCVFPETLIVVCFNVMHIPSTLDLSRCIQQSYHTQVLQYSFSGALIPSDTAVK